MHCPLLFHFTFSLLLVGESCLETKAPSHPSLTPRTGGAQERTNGVMRRTRRMSPFFLLLAVNSSLLSNSVARFISLWAARFATRLGFVLACRLGSVEEKGSSACTRAAVTFFTRCPRPPHRVLLHA